MNLVTLALANLRRRPARSAVVSASVGLALASALSLVTLSDSVGRNAGESADERGADMLVLSRNGTEVFSSFIVEDMGRKLSSIPGVDAVAGELVMFAPVDGDRQNLVTGWARDSFFWKEMKLTAGRAPRAAERHRVVIGQGTAESLRKKVGDTLRIFDETFTVVGIASYQSAINRSMIFMFLPDLQEISFRTRQVTMFDVRLSPRASVETVEQRIASLGPVIAAPTDQMLRRDRNIQVMRAVSQSVSLIALAMGALSVLNTLLMAVQERTREIGVMMAIGWSRGRTMISIVYEGLLIGVAGCLVGIPLSYVISLLFENLPNIGGLLTFRPTLWVALPICAMAILICAVGSLYPAWRAASMSLADALRRM